jgi:hypothetical protein
MRHNETAADALETTLAGPRVALRGLDQHEDGAADDAVMAIVALARDASARQVGLDQVIAGVGVVDGG